MEQENLFKVGLNLDDDLRDVEPGFYTYLKNATTNSTSARNKGGAESLKSWTKKTRFWNAVTKGYSTLVLPSGTNKCIATAKDIKNNAVIFFNKNSNGYHAIYRYWIKPTGLEPFIESLTMYVPGAPPVTWGDTLDFTVRFTNVFVVEIGRTVSEWTEDPEHPVFGSNIPVQFVFWTDGVLPQRRLNTADLFDKIQASVFTIDEQWLNVGKVQPGKSPSLLMGTDTTRETNFLPYNHYQFAIRYKYKDGEYTPLSPISDISLLWKLDYFFLNFDRAVNGADAYNKITVSSSITPHETVAETEWFVRQGNGVGDSDTNPEWYRFSVTKLAATNTTYYGDEETIALSQIDSRTNFYAIPQKSSHQELVTDNQVVYGDITEGYDPVGVVGSVTEISKSVPLALFPKEVVTGGATLFGTYMFSGALTSVSDRAVGDVIYGYYSTIVGGLFTPDIPYSYVLVAGDLTSINTFGTNLAAAITSQSGFSVTYNATYTVLIPAVTVDRLRFELGDNGYCYSQNQPIPCFKEGATHKFGIVHMDEYMRQGAFEEIGDLYIPFVTERYPIGTSYDYVPKVYGAQIEITSQPPIWAKYYKFVHKCSIQKSAEFIVKGFSYSSGTLKVLVTSYKDFVDGDNGPIVSIPFKSKGVVDFPYTEWTGNRMRVMGSTIANADMIDTVKTVSQTYIDVEVLAVELDGSGNVLATISDFGYPIASIGLNSLVEFYKTGYEPVYFELPMEEYEAGIVYGVIDNPGTEIREYDFDVFGSATYETYMGNAYKKWRSLNTGGFPGQFHIDTFSISDWWSSEYSPKGRIQAETPNMKAQNIFSMLRWTGKLFENTNINNTNVFDEGNYKILEQRYGAITGLRLIGYTMKIVQWGNVSSAFIGRREMQNADGSTQLVVTDNLIGTVNPSEELYGSKHPSSIYVKDRAMYFFDVLNRCFVRDDPNGPNDIAKQKATRYWQNISDLIGDNPNSNVITGWDQENKLLYALIVFDGDFHACISFCPDKGYWHSFHDHNSGDSPIDIYGDCKSGLIAFYNGEPWLMNDGPTYLNFLGSAKFMESAAPSNASKEKVKVFNASVVRSNRRPLRSEQSMPESEVNPLGQASEIPGAQYAYKEGVYYASTNRNYLRFGTPADVAAKRYGLVNGDQLRGHACDNKVIFDGSDIVILYSLGTEIIASEKS